MPREVVQRAEAILANLEKVYGSGEIVPSGDIKHRGRCAAQRVAVAESAAQAEQSIQLSMFQLDDPVLVAIRDQIKDLDINSLTPLEALNKLNEIKRITGL
jgi:DNA mismatch repair protein MutS